MNSAAMLAASSMLPREVISNFVGDFEKILGAVCRVFSFFQITEQAVCVFLTALEMI